MRARVKSSVLVVLVVFGSVLWGCAGETLGADELEQGAGARVESAQQGATVQVGPLTVNGWTPWTSEEYPPISCDGNNLMAAAQCSGRYCDNIRTYCQSTGAFRTSLSYWTPYVSDEFPGERVCVLGYWITGISCHGRYCDNKSLLCTRMNNVTPVFCHWTGWVSEENGGLLLFGAGYYARGVRCSGDYCDNMSFYVCRTG